MFQWEVLLKSFSSLPVHTAEPMLVSEIDYTMKQHCWLVRNHIHQYKLSCIIANLSRVQSPHATIPAHQATV